MSDIWAESLETQQTQVSVRASVWTLVSDVSVRAPVWTLVMSGWRVSVRVRNRVRVRVRFRVRVRVGGTDLTARDTSSSICG